MTLKKGDRVKPSGQGRTAQWGPHQGTVTRRLTKATVEVHWDNTHFGDELSIDELQKIEEANA